MSETYSDDEPECPDCEDTGIVINNEGEFDEGADRCPCGVVPEVDDE